MAAEHHWRFGSPARPPHARHACKEALAQAESCTNAAMLGCNIRAMRTCDLNSNTGGKLPSAQAITERM